MIRLNLLAEVFELLQFIFEESLDWINVFVERWVQFANT